MTRVSFRIYENPVILLIQVMMLMLLSDVFFFLVVAIVDFAEKNAQFLTILTAQEEFFSVGLFFQLLLVGYLFFQWMSNYYWFDGGILYHKKGILWTHREEFVLLEVEATTYSQGLLGRIFDYGEVSLVFANQKFILRRIPHPENFVEMVNREKRNTQ